MAAVPDGFGREDSERSTHLAIGRGRFWAQFRLVSDERSAVAARGGPARFDASEVHDVWVPARPRTAGGWSSS
jgi:hypothetical protein